MDYSDIIKSCELFRDMDEGARRDALSFFDARVKKHRKGEIVQLSGTNMPRFGLVLEGAVQVYMDDINGDQMIMANVTPGITFGEALCYLQVEEVPVYIISADDSAVLWMSTDKLRENSTDLTRELHSRFTAMLARRTLNMNDRIQILSKNSLRAKLIAFFSQCSRDQRTFTVNFDRQAMATYLGADRSALSRELSRMKQEGLIDYHKNSFRLLRSIEQEDRI